MKKFQQVIFASLMSLSLIMAGCGPNDNEGGMDSKNSNKEGAVDSTKMPNFDSAQTGNSSQPR